jgi:DNA-binding transcriptional MerR regulator
VRISELERESGVPVATIKYYLREGLLHRGAATASNQAEYDASHVKRLRLIRVLLDVGHLSIADVAAVAEALEDEDLPLHHVVGVAQYALGPHANEPDHHEMQRALDEVDDFLARRRWRVFPDAPSRRTLAEALVALRRLGWAEGTDAFEHYADVASELASWELDQIPLTSGSPSTAVESVVIGTVVFEAVLAALRRLAHEDHSARRLTRRRARSGR